MRTHDDTREPHGPWILAAHPWADVQITATCYAPATATAPARAVSSGWDPATMIALLRVLVCGLIVFAAVQWLEVVLGTGIQRVLVCNSFDSAPATARCTVSDAFVVVHQGATGATLQVTVAGDAPGRRVPVTIDVRESNGAGLVIATGTDRWMLHPDGAGVAVLALQGVFAACRIPLPAAPAGSTNWQQVTYVVAVRERTTILGETAFHVAV
jgi:hypothetical protein